MGRFAWLFSALFSLASPSMAQKALIRDFHTLRACAGDVVKLCSDVLPGASRHAGWAKATCPRACRWPHSTHEPL